MVDIYIKGWRQRARHTANQCYRPIMGQFTLFSKNPLMYNTSPTASRNSPGFFSLSRPLSIYIYIYRPSDTDRERINNIDLIQIHMDMLCSYVHTNIIPGNSRRDGEYMGEWYHANRRKQQQQQHVKSIYIYIIYITKKNSSVRVTGQSNRNRVMLPRYHSSILYIEI